jgi:hypothetical protein
MNTKRIPSLLRRAGVSFLLGFAIFLLGVLLDRLVIHGVSALIADLLVGIAAGLLVFAYEWHRHKLVLRQMRIIAEMNHHVRNALQPILYSPYLKEQAEQIRIIQQGTERIQWALKEVLPGNNEEPPSQQGSRIAA